MKRTELKRKTPLRSRRLTQKKGKKCVKKAKTPIRLAKDKAWEAFSRYIRLRDSIRTTGTADRCICVTCGREFPSFGKGCMHAGHWLGGRRGLNLFEEHGVHGQCAGCNLFGAGKQWIYEQFMTERYGHEEMDRITLQANTSHKWTIDELNEIAEKYTRLERELYEA